MPTSPRPSASASALATLDKVAARTPDGSTLFDNLTLTFGAERTGVVGRNGVGKSTLLRLIAAEQSPSEGSVSLTGTIGVLKQRSEARPDETVQVALGVSAELAVIDRILSGEASGEDLDSADWTLEPRISEALEQVGLAGLALERQTATLSGGERTRLELARLLLAPPDLVLLDEPTNHLDGEARARVAEVLERWPGGAVIVSHDRELLRRMDRIIEISTLGVEVFGGGYDLYAQRKEEARAAAERALTDAVRGASQVRREALARTETKARRDAAGRRKAARGDMPKILLGVRAERAENTSGRDRLLAVRQAEEAEATLEAAQAQVERVRTLSIPMPPTGLPPGRTVLGLHQAEWETVERRRVMGPLDLTVVGPERIAVTGPNGAGKTTLLKMMAGVLEPTRGRVDLRVPAALLDQEAAILDPDETLIEAWRRLNPEGGPNDAQATLARFLFRNVAAHRLVGTLSGGERLRAALACVMTGTAPPQLLILDEPSNHLDLASIEAVEAALRAYDGALVVVSHDEDFLTAIGVDRRISL